MKAALQSSCRASSLLARMLRSAGRVGRSSSADTDLQMHAEILTYSRSQGVFAGVSLQGATLRPDDDANAELYRTKLSNEQIVMGKTKVPETGAELVAELNRYSLKRQ